MRGATVRRLRKSTGRNCTVGRLGRELAHRHLSELKAAVRYENLLTRSFAIVRRKPWLWLLALLAGQTASGGGGSSSGSGYQQFQARSAAAPPDVAWLPQWLADRTLLFVEIGIALLVFWLVWFLVSCIASGALVGAVARLDGGEPITFSAAWRIGVGSFGRVLAFKLLLLLAFLLPALPLLVPLLLGVAGGNRGLLIGFGLDLPLLFAYFYWALFIGWLSELALRACVLEKLGAWSAFLAAWALLRRSFHRVALTTAVFIGVGFGIGILTSVILSLVEVPFLGSITTEIVEGRWSDLAGTALIAVAIVIPVSLAVSSAVGAYFATAWTVAYRRFDLDGQVPVPPQLAA